MLSESWLLILNKLAKVATIYPRRIGFLHRTHLLIQTKTRCVDYVIYVKTSIVNYVVNNI